MQDLRYLVSGCFSVRHFAQDSWQVLQQTFTCHMVYQIREEESFRRWFLERAFELRCKHGYCYLRHRRRGKGIVTTITSGTTLSYGRSYGIVESTITQIRVRCSRFLGFQTPRINTVSQTGFNGTQSVSFRELLL